MTSGRFADRGVSWVPEKRQHGGKDLVIGAVSPNCARETEVRACSVSLADGEVGRQICSRTNQRG